MNGPSLAARFPALGRLRGGRRQRIPYVGQATTTDCAAACLAMVLGLHGKAVDLAALRDLMGSGPLGTDAATLIAAGRHHGLRGRALRIEEVADLRLLDSGAILHWRFNHFVVLERIGKRGAWVVDPGLGRRLVGWRELDRAFTGIAITFEPADGFHPAGDAASNLGHYLRQLRVHGALLGRILVACFAIQALALALPVLTGLVVDRVLPRGDEPLLVVLALGCALLVGCKLLASLLRASLLLELRTRVEARMTLEFLDHLVHLPYAFFQRRSSGDLLLRLNSNSTLREILTSSAVSGLFDGAMVSLYLVLLLLGDPGLGLLVVGLAALRLLVFAVTRRRQRELMAESLQVEATSRAYQLEILTGIETLKVAGAEDRAVERWSHLLVGELNVALDRGRLEAWSTSLHDALATASPLVLLLYGAVSVLRGELSLGSMLALLAVAQGFLMPLTTLVSTATQLQLLRSYLERIADVVATPRETSGSRRPRSLRGRLTLEAVTFRYSPLTPPVVEDVSVDIQPGQLVAIVGASGSGKSTLAALLAGLYLPERGRILYDGIDLAELDLGWLRRQLGFVTQSPYLFGQSVRANIAMSDPDLPLARVVEAARLAAIDADIEALPMRYETLLADGGASLSGGQRQRLALARALVHRPSVLLLDEATSALDALTEARIRERLARLRSTRIVVAHRLSTVRDADAILVLDRGRVVETGDHAALMARGGRYRELVEIQLAGAQRAAGADAIDSGRQRAGGGKTALEVADHA